MDSSDLLKKVRKIEIRTRRLTQQVFSGQYHSAFKGRGMAFSEVREYQYGDDIRSIDWNVTARFNHPYVKIFEEERELTVMLLLDVSASNLFGTRGMYKKEMITELAAVLSFSAITNNDKVGVIFFSNTVEKFIPPQKGRTHILRIIRELLHHQPEQRKTNIAEALRYLNNAIKKRCTAFVISDFLDNDFEQALKIAKNKHDIVAIQTRDQGENQLHPMGLMQIKDAESGKVSLIDTSDPAFRKHYQQWWIEKDKSLQEIFQKTGIDCIKLFTDKDYVPALKNLFLKRSVG
ncbi:MAG: DUF58 domain-containing protein [Bacteroidales bacterium]|jgi:uncharacterized protein (DUF58 family)|nr:DUF58 domain-containing protein [Bacteroidales bacterium]